MPHNCDDLYKSTKTKKRLFIVDSESFMRVLLRLSESILLLILLFKKNIIILI